MNVRALVVGAGVAARQAVDAFGGLQVLFNNAGIEYPSGPLTDSPVEAWDRVLAVNLRGVYLGMKFGVAAMLKSGGGSIINTSSIAGVIGFPGLAAYCAAKAGVIGLTKSAALDYARLRIRINAICPGLVDTPLVSGVAELDPALAEQLRTAAPLGRIGTPEEIAKMALFLASDDSSYCTGAVYLADGGWVAR